MKDENIPELWEWKEDWPSTTLPAFEGAWCAFQQVIQCCGFGMFSRWQFG